MNTTITVTVVDKQVVVGQSHASGTNSPPVGSSKTLTLVGEAETFILQNGEVLTVAELEDDALTSRPDPVVGLPEVDHKELSGEVFNTLAGTDDE